MVDRDMELAGHALPKGTMLWFPFHAMHRSRHVWQRPEEFDPSRWLQQTAKSHHSKLSNQNGASAQSYGNKDRARVSGSVSKDAVTDKTANGSAGAGEADLHAEVQQGSTDSGVGAAGHKGAGIQASVTGTKAAGKLGARLRTASTDDVLRVQSGSTKSSSMQHQAETVADDVSVKPSVDVDQAPGIAQVCLHVSGFEENCHASVQHSMSSSMCCVDMALAVCVSQQGRPLQHVCTSSHGWDHDAMCMPAIMGDEVFVNR